MASGGDTMAPSRKPTGQRKIHDPMRRGGDRERREHDASHGEKRDRAQIELELAPAHQEG